MIKERRNFTTVKVRKGNLKIKKKGMIRTLWLFGIIPISKKVVVYDQQFMEVDEL